MTEERTQSLAAPEAVIAREKEWIEVYRDTIPELYRRLSRRTGGERELTEDLTQEAWLRLLAAHAAEPPPRDPLAWLTTTATNLLRNHFRRARPEPLSGPVPDWTEPDVLDEDGATAKLVQWGLARLGEPRASLLEAHYFDGRPLVDIARERNLSARAVEGRLRRARQALERLLAPHLGGLLP